MMITIRRATPNDAGAWARHMSQPEVYGALLQMPYANEESWRQRLVESCAPAKPDLLLSGELHGEVVATAGLHPAGAQLRRRHAMSLGISVSPEAQGRGVGSALMTAMCDYADRWVGALRLELTVYADNERAIGLYRKFGFVVEGTLRGFALRDGRFVDALAMARFHPAPPAIGG